MHETSTDPRASQQAYLRLWREAEALLLRQDPCRFAGGVCASGLDSGCCICHRHHPGRRCPVRSLGCKLHVCQRVEQEHPELARQLLAIGRKARALGFSSELFSTWDGDGRRRGDTIAPCAWP